MQKLLNIWCMCVLLGLGQLLGGCESTNEAFQPSAPQEFTAVDLAMAYQFDEVEADNIFKDSILQITGEVLSSFESNDGEFSLELGGYNSLHVDCKMQPLQVSMAKAVHLNTKVRVQGKCDGNWGSIVLRNCTLLDTGLVGP